jgi:hypothetical protein
VLVFTGKGLNNLIRNIHDDDDDDDDDEEEARLITNVSALIHRAETELSVFIMPGNFKCLPSSGLNCVSKCSFLSYCITLFSAVRSSCVLWRGGIVKRPSLFPVFGWGFELEQTRSFVKL